MKYKVGDMIRNPSFDEVDDILEKYEAEWIDVGLLLITKVKTESEE